MQFAQGLADSTLIRDESWLFFCLGRSLQLQGRHAEARKPLALASCLRPEREDYSKYLGQARRRAA